MTERIKPAQRSPCLPGRGKVKDSRITFAEILRKEIERRGEEKWNFAATRQIKEAIALRGDPGLKHVLR